MSDKYLMCPVKLQPKQEVEEMIKEILASGQNLGTVSRPGGEFILSIRLWSFGMIEVTSVNCDGVTEWVELVPFAYHDTVSSIALRAFREGSTKTKA